jgi:hypothetical protein
MDTRLRLTLSSVGEFIEIARRPTAILILAVSAILRRGATD